MHQIFAQIAIAFFQSQKKVVKIRFGRTLAFAIRFISMTSFYFFSLVDPLLSLVLSFLFQSVFFMSYALYNMKNVSIKFPTKDLMVKYVKYFFPFIFSTSSIFLIHQIPIVLLSNFGYPKGEIGIYSTAYQLYAWMLLFPSLITQVLLPTLSKDVQNSSINHETENKIMKTHKYITIISLFITIASFIFSEQLIKTFFVRGYSSSGIILTILVLGKSYELASIAYVTVLQAKKFVYYSEIMYILNLIIFLITIYFFISPDFLKMGIHGAAFAWLVSSFVYWTIFDIITCIKYKYKFYWGILWLFLIFFAIIIIDYYFLRPILSKIVFPLNIIIEGVICLSLFGGSLFIFKITDKNDFELVKKILNPKKFLEEMKKQMEP
jgi:O-antigen/teichoic acid export membrane protein